MTSIFDNNSQFTVNQALGFVDKYLTNDSTHSAQFAMWINNHRQQIAETFSTAVQSKDYNAATTSQDFMNAIYDEANASILKRVQREKQTRENEAPTNDSARAEEFEEAIRAMEDERTRQNASEPIASDAPDEEYKPPKKQRPKPQKAVPSKSADEYVNEINGLIDADSQDAESVEAIMRLIEEARTAYPTKRIAHKAASHLGLKKLPTDADGIHHLPVGEIVKRVRARLEQIASGIVDETTQEPQRLYKGGKKRGRQARKYPTANDFYNLADNLDASILQNQGNQKAIDEALERVIENFRVDLKFGVDGLVEAAHAMGLPANNKSSAKSVAEKIKNYVRKNGGIDLRNYDWSGLATKPTEETTEESVEET